MVLPDTALRGDDAYHLLKALVTINGIGTTTCVPSQMVLSGSLRRQRQRSQIVKNILHQKLLKLGAWLWVPAPLPDDRLVMAVGIDACRQSSDGPAVQTLCASTNRYVTSFFSTWRTRDVARKGVFAWPPGDLLWEALTRFRRLHGRLPDSLVIYRGGISESQEQDLLDQELHGEHGILNVIRQEAGEQDIPMALAIVRRGTHARFRMDDYSNMRSEACISEQVVAKRQEPGVFDFCVISQSLIA